MPTAPYELYPEESVCVQVKTVQGFILYRIVFNPRPVRAFLITRTVKGGGGRTPGNRPLVVAELRGKTCDASRRDLAIAHIVFSPRSTFDLVWSGQRVIFSFTRS